MALVHCFMGSCMLVWGYNVSLHEAEHEISGSLFIIVSTQYEGKHINASRRKHKLKHLLQPLYCICKEVLASLFQLFRKTFALETGSNKPAWKWSKVHYLVVSISNGTHRILQDQGGGRHKTLDRIFWTVMGHLSSAIMHLWTWFFIKCCQAQSQLSIFSRRMELAKPGFSWTSRWPTSRLLHSLHWYCTPNNWARKH